MNEIKKRAGNLPAKIEDLQKYILVGRQVLKAHVAKLKAISAVEEGQVAHQAALEDTQDMAEILLYAEARMGALIPPLSVSRSSSSKGTCSLPKGINKKQSHYAQELNRHQDAIAEVVAEAREKGEVPIRQHVLKAIQANKPKPEPVPLPKGKFSVIYADPPWKYSDTCEAGGVQSKGADKHYPLMSIEELCGMDIVSISNDNAVLFMWVTSPLLEECFDVINAWDFKYKASFVWDKVKHNMGHYNSVRHEFLLICTKGSFTPEKIKLFDSVQSIKKTKKHSQKPHEFREIIQTLYPSAKKVELFARETFPGWEAFGNEL